MVLIAAGTQALQDHPPATPQTSQEARGSPAARSQASSPLPQPLYETREVHDPNGIGKFYLGREIAHVMGHQAADWLERPEREEEEKTDLMVDALHFREGEIVADIGCGSGYVARKIAKKVGESGVV